MYAKYGVRVELVNKRWVYANKECTLNTAITVFAFRFVIVVINLHDELMKYEY